MNIDAEVKKYTVKKERLLNNLISKLQAFSAGKQRAVNMINSTIGDLNRQKDKNLGEISKASMAINALKSD